MHLIEKLFKFPILVCSQLSITTLKNKMEFKIKELFYKTGHLDIITKKGEYVVIDNYELETFDFDDHVTFVAKSIKKEQEFILIDAQDLFYVDKSSFESREYLIGVYDFHKIACSMFKRERQDYVVQPGVIKVLQTACENFIINIFKKANMLASHNGRVVVMPYDMNVTNWIRNKYTNLWK